MSQSFPQMTILPAVPCASCRTEQASCIGASEEHAPRPLRPCTWKVSARMRLMKPRLLNSTKLGSLCTTAVASKVSAASADSMLRRSRPKRAATSRASPSTTSSTRACFCSRSSMSWILRGERPLRQHQHAGWQEFAHFALVALCLRACSKPQEVATLPWSRSRIV